jgi:HK97 family phage prohead protease
MLNRDNNGNGLEYRYIPLEEMKTSKTDEGKMIVEGYAIVYNREANIWGDIEVILPGAATEALKTQDQYYLWQHDRTFPLARVKIGTLTATEDEKGVYIKAEIVNTQFGRDRYEDIRSGLVDKQSFAFNVKEGSDEWVKETKDGKGIWKRTIKVFSVIPEFSAVTWPAYNDTDLQAKRLALRNKPDSEASGRGGTAVLEVLKDARENIIQIRKGEKEYAEKS